jgi:hypothetical protein
MSLDNSPKVSSILKTTDAFPSQLQCRRTRTIPDVSPTTLQHSKQSCSMPCFVPRPFPPPSLVHVPVEYIIDQLHYLAPHYWNRPETTDCTISEIYFPPPPILDKSDPLTDLSCPRTTTPRKVDACPRHILPSRNSAFSSEPSRSCWFGQTSHRANDSLNPPNLIKCMSLISSQKTTSITDTNTAAHRLSVRTIYFP